MTCHERCCGPYYTLLLALAVDGESSEAPPGVDEKVWATIAANQGKCERVCTCRSLAGGLFSLLHARVFCLLEAIDSGCSLVGTPMMPLTPYLNARYCGEAGDGGWDCHLEPLSTCDGEGTVIYAEPLFEANREKLAKFGQRGELAIFGALAAWVARPKPHLRDWIERNASSDCLAVHVRHGDRLRDPEARRASTAHFAKAAVRLCGIHGISRIRLMSDDRDALFSLRALLAPLAVDFLDIAALPSSMIASRDEIMVKIFRRRHDRLAAAEHDEHFDEAFQLLAEAHVLARCEVFLGSMISNVDHAIVELMASRRRRPVIYDLNGMLWAPGAPEHSEQDIARSDRLVFPAWVRGKSTVLLNLTKNTTTVSPHPKRRRPRPRTNNKRATPTEVNRAVVPQSEVPRRL